MTDEPKLNAREAIDRLRQRLLDEAQRVAEEIPPDEEQLAGRLTREKWLALCEKRQAEGLLIDPATCENVWWFGDIGDPYGDYPASEDACVGRLYFARRPPGPWIEHDDLPCEVANQLSRPGLGTPIAPPDLLATQIMRSIVKIVTGGETEQVFASLRRMLDECGWNIVKIADRFST